jgi:NADPH:quinone reductase-like Zn-dependent oxidoreductase
MEVPQPICPDDGVLIRVEAAAIEGGDLISRASIKPPHLDFVIGYAAAGEIIEVGQNVSNRHVGQKVTSFDLSGSHAELRAIPVSRTWPVPEGPDMPAAAALPITFGTAYNCFFTRGVLKRGETVLVPAGATVIATVSGS